MLRSILSSRDLPDLIVLVAVIAFQAAIAAYLRKDAGAARQRRINVLLWISISWLGLCYPLRFEAIARYLPSAVTSWAQALGIVWAIMSVPLLAALALSKRLEQRAEPIDPARRAILKTAQTAMFVAPAVALGYGTFLERYNLQLREQEIRVPGLHPDLHGLKLVQVTDIHLGPFLSRNEFARAIAMANETRAHVALITGDLISTGNDPLDDCLAELARLRADAGVFGCLGNHETYAEAEDYTTHHAARLGMRFLRHENRQLRFGKAALNLTGVDYQRREREYLAGAERLIVPGTYNLLMSHNPDVYPVAARKGFNLTVAGHTHGGQVKVEILKQNVNVARFFTPYVDGLYEARGAAVFVSRGIGTIGVPTRLGVPPEVVLLKLARA